MDLNIIDNTYSLLAVGIAFIIGHLIIQRKNSFKLTLQYRLFCCGIIMFILFFSLPRTPWVATISSHLDFNDIKNKEIFLNYLEKSNDTIDRLIDIIQIMIFMTLFCFITIVSSIIKHFKIDKSVE